MLTRDLDSSVGSNPQPSLTRNEAGDLPRQVDTVRYRSQSGEAKEVSNTTSQSSQEGGSNYNLASKKNNKFSFYLEPVS